MKIFFQDLIAALIILLALVGYREYRYRQVDEVKWEYQPRRVQTTVLPEGTQFEATLLGGIPETPVPGDEVVARTTLPVTAGGQSAIPTGTRLEGMIREVLHENSNATVLVEFVSMDLKGTEISIETEPVVATARVKHDLDVLGDAIETVTGAAVGAGIAANSRTEEGIAEGMVGGAVGGTTPPEEYDVPLTFRLSRPLELIE
jgi:hypothetical protein